jgi:hypothetical protein
VRAEARVVEQHDREQRHAAAHEPARAEAVGEAAGLRGDQDDEDRHRQERGARLHRRIVEHALHVDRDVEEGPEHCEADEQHRRVRAAEGAVAEERQVEHRRPLVPLEQREGDQRDHGDRERDDDPAGGPAVLVRLDKRVGEREQAGARGREARDVRALMERRVPRLVDEERDRDQAEGSDRHVDEEDPVPVGVLRQQAADERADRERHRRDACPDADGRAALPRRERGGDDREGRRVHQRGAEPLDDACTDQEVAARCEAAGERGGREDGQPDHEDQAPAEQVGELAAREHEGCERQRVAGDDPFELRELHVQRRLHPRQGHVDDRVVEHDHEQPDRHRTERPPLLVLRRHEPLPHRATSSVSSS